ncbi:unnamed protein product [Clonostachys rosea]|uniref:Type 1 phosphatases regulator n=1 Tax=Bionectria ochroleuca TaxID=29856 RepID=A0ABY6TWP0_BIOOC|nr:unnamed protein product [Clonostachys rosea]
MSLSQQQQRAAPSTSAPSQTATATPQTQTQSPTRILRLRGDGTSTGRSVQWADDVVDNEGLGRKSSKVCCIYHKPKAVDESSDESSSDSDSDSSSDEPDADHRGKGKQHDHDHCGRKGKRDGKPSKRAPSPNAYEKVPKPRPKAGEPSGSKP